MSTAKNQENNQRRVANWESKLGFLTPKATPSEIVCAILNGGRERALEMLETAGHIPMFPGFDAALSRDIADFYGIDRYYIRAKLNEVYRVSPLDVPVEKIQVGSRQVLKTIRDNGIRCAIREEKSYYLISVCGIMPPDFIGCGCDQFKIPRSGSATLHSPEVVLAAAVMIFTGRYTTTSRVADNLLKRIITSEYIADALKARSQRHTKFVESAKAKAQDNHVEDKPHDDMIATTKVDAKPIKDTTTPSRQLDAYKTTIALLWNLTTMLAAPVLEEVMPGQIEGAMKKITEGGIVPLALH